jgi:hypothetical protein
MEISHSNAVPQTDIDGTIVIGYNDTRLSQLLGIAD